VHRRYLALFCLGTLHSQEGMDEEGQRDEAVPRVLFADLVLIQSDLVLGRLEGDLDRPASLDHSHQLLQRVAARGEDGIAGPVLRTLQAPTHETTRPPSGLALRLRR
jgi:hypothetical protein